MILLRLISSISGQPLISITDPNAYNNACNFMSDTWFKIWQFMFLGFAMAFFIAFVDSIFQIFGVYNMCHCRTAVSFSGPSESGTAHCTAQAVEDARNKHCVDRITLAAVVVTAILCYFGWWYQKLIRRAIAVELGRL